MMGLNELLENGRHSRKVLLFIVYVALFLDNMLLTTVVPIMPEYLLRLAHPNETEFSWSGRKSAAKPSTRSLPTGPRPVPPRRTTTTTMAYDDYHELDDDFPEENEILTSTSTISTYSTSRSANDTGPKQESTSVAEENVWVGLMFGSKALVQLITNPFVGPLTNRVGYTIPMFTGFVIMFLSTLVFAFGKSYTVLFFARSLQGIGSACTSSSGMGMLAQAYPDDGERGAVMGIALGGLALGVLVGPPFGGVLYDISGKELPFIILALLALFDGALQVLVLQPKMDRGEQEGTALKTLVKDPYIDIAAGAITIGNLGIAMLEPSLPLWMMATMNATSSTRGMAFLPASISYLIGTNIFGPLAYRIGRWLSAMLGLIIIGGCLIAIPSATSVYGLIAPNGFMGLAIGMIDAAMFPQMGYLVDLRHVGVYGSIYAIADAAFCLAFALGPFFSGPIVRNLGFPAMLYIIAVVNFTFAPFMLLLRRPPAVDTEKEHLIANGDGVRYEKFDDTIVDGVEAGVSKGCPVNTFTDYDYRPAY